MRPSLGLQLCMFTAFMASFVPWQGSQYPTLLPAIQPEEFSSSSKIEQLLQMGILHFQLFVFCRAKARTTHVRFARTRHKKFCPPGCHAVFFFNTILRML